MEGDDIDVLKFPVPRHHEQDKARYIGTANCVITKDPDNGSYNVGTYRNQVYDAKTIGCQITEGKHGRIHRDKYFERGEECKFVILVGEDPLLYMLSGESPAGRRLRTRFRRAACAAKRSNASPDLIQASPFQQMLRSPSKVLRVPGKVKQEGPFGEWMGYYSDDSVPRAYVEIKTILHRK